MGRKLVIEVAWETLGMRAKKVELSFLPITPVFKKANTSAQISNPTVDQFF